MEAYIVGGVRTAVGRFNGTLAPLTTIDLGAAVIKEVILRTGVPTEGVHEVIMGRTLVYALSRGKGSFTTPL